MKLHEILDFYKYHDDPKSLRGYDKAYETVPALAWQKYRYDVKELKKREQLWAQDPECAYWYARDIIKRRFPKGEDAIAKDPIYSYWYALKIINGRFPKGENAIPTDPQCAFQYARDIIKGRWPKGEDAIATDPDYAYLYACKIIQNRFPKGEEAIKLIPYLWIAYNVRLNITESVIRRPQLAMNRNTNKAKKIAIRAKSKAKKNNPGDEITPSGWRADAHQGSMGGSLNWR